MSRVPPLRVVVVDDEPPALDLLRRTVGEQDGVRLVGACPGGADAVRTIREEAPDLVFLDVRMPEVDGFDVIDRIGPDRMPEVVFVTAHEEHALDAFRVHAVDYVVKPYEAVRIREALEHARGRIRAGRREGLGARLEALVQEMAGAEGSPTPPARRLTVRGEDRIYFVEVARIDWLEADDKSVRVHEGSRVHTVRTSLSGLLDRLGPGRFVRIHRSAAVNLDRVREIQPWGHGDHVAVLDTGARLRVSRTFKDALLKLVH